ncbi:MAG: 4-hydroxythreonine-4-phosphate dehydrogenase PdxA [Acetobacteraceae bacterium]
MNPLALTMGDPAGIGGELTLQAWQALRTAQTPFVALDDPDRLRALAGTMGLDVPVAVVDSPEAATAVFAHALPVLPVPLAHPPVAGQPDKSNAPAVVQSIERAAGLALRGAVGAVVTNPINKAALYDAGFAYPGHTEFLADLTGAIGKQVMMLASPVLRVVPVTVHASLRDAIAMLSTDMIVSAARTTATAMQRDFGVAAPRLAVAGLNPHAGEQGALGDDEARIIVPAMDALRAEGIDVSGPWPPDTMFTAAARTKYDAAICMYHDQALIPLKTLDMDHGVNVTLGLPIVRTSPDHGTAYDIAGKGVAHPTSLISALELAAHLAGRRAQALRQSA